MFAIDFALLLGVFHMASAQKGDKNSLLRLENPISVEYLQLKLKKTGPKLVLNTKIKENLKKKLKTDSVILNIYKAIQLNTAAIQKEPLLKRVLEGRWLLGISREMLYRMNMLGMVYRMGKKR